MTKVVNRNLKLHTWAEILILFSQLLFSLFRHHVWVCACTSKRDEQFVAHTMRWWLWFSRLPGRWQVGELNCSSQPFSSLYVKLNSNLFITHRHTASEKPWKTADIFNSKFSLICFPLVIFLPSTFHIRHDGETQKKKPLETFLCSFLCFFFQGKRESDDLSKSWAVSWQWKSMENSRNSSCKMFTHTFFSTPKCRTFANMPCGIMDQFVSVMGKERHALLIDCQWVIWESIKKQSLGKLLNFHVHHRVCVNQC